jgi:hypothetical protein
MITEVYSLERIYINIVVGCWLGTSKRGTKGTGCARRALKIVKSMKKDRKAISILICRLRFEQI